MTQAEGSWITIYDEVIGEDNDIEDLDLGVPSIELDVSENLLIDIIIPSTTRSDKQSSAPNPVSQPHGS